jgi:hypothetical protein
MLISGRALVALTEGAGRCAGLGVTVGGIWTGGLPRKGTTVEGKPVGALKLAGEPPAVMMGVAMVAAVAQTREEPSSVAFLCRSCARLASRQRPSFHIPVFASRAPRQRPNASASHGLPSHHPASAPSGFLCICLGSIFTGSGSCPPAAAPAP